MGNMSYCRFENTVSDLADCQEALGNGKVDDLNEYEQRAKDRLLKICQEIAADYGDAN